MISEKGGSDGGKGRLIFKPSQCILGKSRLANCSLCAQVCPKSAIQCTETVTLDENACSLCGLCLHTCPVGAFSLEDDGYAELIHCFKELGAPSTLELGCKLNPVLGYGPAIGEAVIQTSQCLAILGPSAFLRLYVLGVRSIDLWLERCLMCPVGNLKDAIVGTASRAAALIEGMGGRLSILAMEEVEKGWESREVFTTSHPPVSRRSFFRFTASESAKIATRAALGEAQFKERQKELPPERRRFLEAFDQLAASLHFSNPEVVVPFEGFARLSVHASCDACGACARICPTQALEASSQEENGSMTWTLSFSARRCLDCGLCRIVCSKKSLIESGRPSIMELADAEPKVLFRGITRQCLRCKVRFLPGNAEETLCHHCNRQKSIHQRLTGFRNSMMAQSGPASKNST